MKRAIRILPLAVGLLSLAPASWPAQLQGVSFPDKQDVAGKELKLNGLGVREAKLGFVKVKVYVAGLYVENPTNDAQAILDSKQPKKLDLHFVHAASADKVRDAWKEGLEKNCARDCGSMTEPLKQLESFMTDVKPGDSMSFEFLSNGVGVAVNGQEKGLVSGSSFSRNLLSIWLGPQPPNESLKEGLLARHEGG